jgi:histidine ammonia-lyase
MSITASALTAEALKLTLPASIFSRSTESHNQDKVPMATLAARDALRVVELVEQVVAIVSLGASQAVDLRTPAADHGSLHAKIRGTVPALVGDRRMDVDIQAVLKLIRADELSQ